MASSAVAGGPCVTPAPGKVGAAASGRTSSRPACPPSRLSITTSWLATRPGRLGLAVNTPQVARIRSRRKALLCLSLAGSGGPREAIITAKPAANNKIEVRVDISAKESQKIFDDVLVELGKSAPAVPGFRKSKGGKTSNVPKAVLLQMLGEQRVRSFVIDRIINSCLADYVEKEGINAKKDVKTRQSAEELTGAFEPGKAFGFDATIVLEEKEAAEALPQARLCITTESSVMLAQAAHIEGPQCITSIQSKPTALQREMVCISSNHGKLTASH
eukprot:SM000226S07428  [mRNA]  locus=s226:144240:147423:- [translate_table: standard]